MELKDLDPESIDVHQVNENISRIYNEFNKESNAFFLILIGMLRIEFMINKIIDAYYKQKNLEKEIEFTNKILNRVSIYCKIQILEELTKKIRIKNSQDMYKYLKKKKLFQKINNFHIIRNIIAHDLDYENVVKEKIKDQKIIIDFLNKDEVSKELLSIIYSLDYIRAHLYKE